MYKYLELAPCPTYSRCTRAKCWMKEWIFVLKETNLYSRYRCIHCKTIDVYVFDLRIYPCCILEVHWVVQVQSTWVKKIRLTMKSPIHSTLLCPTCAHLAYYSIHHFLSVPSPQNSLVGSTGLFFWPYSDKIPLACTLTLIVTSAEKQKPSDSLSTDKWGCFTFPGVIQMSLKKAEETTVEENLGTLLDDRREFRKLPTLTVNRICWESWGIKWPSSIRCCWDFCAVGAAVLTFLLTSCWVIHYSGQLLLFEIFESNFFSWDRFLVFSVAFSHATELHRVLISFLLC